MKIKQFLLFLLLTLFPVSQSLANPARNYDVSDYDVALRLNLDERSIAGLVRIKLASDNDTLREVELDAKKLVIDGVWENGKLQKYNTKDERLVVSLARPALVGETRTLTIAYHGKPTVGMRFFPGQVYTVFHTSDWLVCNDQPHDKASLTLRLTAPTGLKVVACGNLIREEQPASGAVLQVWRQDKPVPTYTFGFAAGTFQELTRRRNGVGLHFLATTYSPAELDKIFSDTGQMIDYFERRAGIAYPGRRYSQILVAGDVAQEMTGFTVLRESYGSEVLDDARENWLIAHELAHQWWGNQVTCWDWSDFWLNEGLVTYMVAAFKETRFGQDEYDREMEIARRRYERARASGTDRPLVYYKWSDPAEMGGPITYSKGALIFHLLRYQIGEEAFWNGLRAYTRVNFGGSVTTKDLQRSMETASGQNLTQFFDHWVYSSDLPAIVVRQQSGPNEITLEIEQKQTVIWPIPLRVAVETKAGRQSRRVMLTQRHQEVRIEALGEVLSVRIDEGGHLPFRVIYERSSPMLLYQLAHEPDVPGRVDALNQLQKLCESSAEEASCAAFKQSLRELSDKDPSRFVRMISKTTLESLNAKKK